MGVSSSPTGANGCIVVRGGTHSTREAPSDRARWNTIMVVRTGRGDRLLTSGIEAVSAGHRVQLRSRRACFQGQQSAKAVQRCTGYCSWAVNGLALSPGSLGSAQAFQTPSRRSQCSAAAVPPGQSFAKRLEKTLRGQQRVKQKTCPRVEFKVTLCYLMTPKRMLVHSASL